jgi:hypothetical protein
MGVEGTLPHSQLPILISLMLLPWGILTYQSDLCLEGIWIIKGFSNTLLDLESSINEFYDYSHVSSCNLNSVWIWTMKDHTMCISWIGGTGKVKSQRCSFVHDAWSSLRRHCNTLKVLWLSRDDIPRSSCKSIGASQNDIVPFMNQTVVFLIFNF